MPSHSLPRAIVRVSFLIGAGLGLVAAPSAPLVAQSEASPGDLVRILSSNGGTAVEGRLVTLTGEGVSYVHTEGREVQLPSTSVRSLEVARSKRHWGLGLVLGIATGATIGAILKPTDSTRDCFSCNQEFGNRNERFFSGVAGAALGGIAGAAVGLLVRTESWEPVVVPWTMDGGGAAVGGRVRF